MNGAEWVFAGGALWALWVVIGYPIVLGLRARRENPVQKGPLTPTVSVILPVRNGEAFLADKLESLFGQVYPAEQIVDILVISDGSTDRTEEMAQQYAGRGVRLLRQPASGKCAALNLAIPEARGELLLMTDVRQRLKPDCLAKLAACFADPRVGAASGELVILDGETAAEARVGLYWRFESWIRRSLSRVDSMLGATGPIYALRRELAVDVPPECLLDDMYLPLAAFRKGFRLVQEPEAVAWDYPTDLESEFRRKVRTLAGNYQLLRYYPWLLGPDNRMWLDYMSIKIGRLLLPFAMLAMLGSGPFLRWPWGAAAVSGQALFYLLAGGDPYLPESWGPLKKLSSAARAFTVMMLAALLAASVFFTDPRRLWKETRVRKAGHAA
jgi:cellulose synthase/poly-beta-1,6-N-acetylglucosamine synthase-like glycosyltransferase